MNAVYICSNFGLVLEITMGSYSSLDSMPISMLIPDNVAVAANNIGTGICWNYSKRSF